MDKDLFPHVETRLAETLAQLQGGGIPEECVPREPAFLKGKVTGSEGTPRKRVQKGPIVKPDDGKRFAGKRRKISDYMTSGSERGSGSEKPKKTHNKKSDSRKGFKFSEHDASESDESKGKSDETGSESDETGSESDESGSETGKKTHVKKKVFHARKRSEFIDDMAEGDGEEDESDEVEDVSSDE
jgi:hypothetical protein